ncbi:prohead protease [Clostridium botulinum C/D]|uniref:hypothetical protein n=1 Tax=Clostridium botulinum TaxID=1491 RepID=UPI0002FD99CF|nr:hypothetical protein [Clostridium botulinum]KEI02906.1 prohead protease [Clostridium botulinum C/D str. Sp77]KOA76877.1 prohead protease [Clostridium botulinum]KOA80922.1 prohead protease [Clostridium botulinum]KOA88982.1 prohead protease [Clostridium botulinum]KOC31851.1 prohead protease [Clostridium botulinum]
MSIKQLLNKILNDSEIINLLPNKKAFFLRAEAPQNPYLEYEIVNEYGANYEGNKETFTTYVIQVDIFSKGDYTSLEDIVKKKLLSAGFNRDMAADLYEKDTKLFHKAMRFSITLKS